MISITDIIAQTQASPRSTAAGDGFSLQGACPQCAAPTAFFITQFNGVPSFECVACDSSEDHLLSKWGITSGDEVLSFDDRTLKEVMDQLRREIGRREAKALLAKQETLEDVAQIEWLPVNELLKRDLPESRYRIQDLWPIGGNVVFSGQAKAGKSSMILNIVRSLITGEKFLGQFEVEKVTGRVVIADLELNESNLQAWYRASGIDTDQVILLPMRGKAGTLAKHLLDDRARAELVEDFKRHDAEVLIIDPLSVLLNGLGIDENSASEVGRVLRYGIAALQTEAEISELFVAHHTGHGGDRSRGSSVIQDWPDAIWQLTVDKTADDDEDILGDVHAPSRYLSARGRDVELSESLLDFNTETKQMSIGQVGVSKTRAKRLRVLNAREKTVVEVLKDGPVRGSQSLSQMTDLSGSNLTATVARLVERGEVLKVKEPGDKAFTYSLSEEYREAMERVHHGIEDSPGSMILEAPPLEF